MGKCENCGHSIQAHTYGNMGVLRPDCTKCKCSQYKNKSRDMALKKSIYDDFF